MTTFLILLAAGDSKRLKSNTPKPYHIINGKTLLEHSIDSFKFFPEIKKILVVYNKNHVKYLNKLKLKNVLKIKGGKSRQESTFNALKKIKKMNCDKVLIHDSARPNTPKKMISEIINSLKINNVVVPILKATDSTKRIKKKKIYKNIERNSLRFTQTPQGFNFHKIFEKHYRNRNLSIDDDSSLFTNSKEKIFTVNGSKKNLKITNKDDLDIFKSLKMQKLFFGIGFDIHKLVPKKKLYLGGLYIKSPLGTLGHSDGDPVLHSTIDAILGASGLGDIGMLFPGNDKKYKNIRSTKLLKKVVRLIKDNNFLLNNIDINIIAQKLKIKKYSKKMINLISQICEINPNKINIKGKTTEKLGLIGKEKAIASEVIVSVIKYE